MNAGSPLNEIMALRAALAQAEARADAAEADAAQAEAKVSSDQAFIAYLKLEIEKLRRDLYGVRSERKARLLDQLELQLEELEATASEDELAAEQAAAKTTRSRRSPAGSRSRKPFPDHLPRERVVVPVPPAAPAAVRTSSCKLGETITETLESIPRQWKVIQTVRERFSCRDCETITQPPAPFHTIPRAWAGPSLLAMVLFEKFGQHQPLNRQCERFAREGVEISLSTLADQVGDLRRRAEALASLIEAHVMAAERLHGDDTTVPVLAKGKTDTGRIWVYVRDDRPFGGPAPPAALFHYSRDRCGEHAEQHLTALPASSRPTPSRDTTGCMRRIASRARITGSSVLGPCAPQVLCPGRYRGQRPAQARQTPPPISPLALEAVKSDRRAVRHRAGDQRPEPGAAPGYAPGAQRTAGDRAGSMDAHRTGPPVPPQPVAKAMDYMLKRWETFTVFLRDGRVCLTNNAAERALRGIALGRKAWLFAGSDRGGQRAAVMFSLIITAKMNDVDPQAWLADVLARINDLPQTRLHELLPWEWRAIRERAKAA